ncbi:MAG: RluA family pseudouridine synthase [Acidobacteria bacterium]|nr:RluA family pseudouridine synthase [Acidobacteriota bacterium]
MRLDQFLLGRIPGESRSQIQNWIRKGYLLVNGSKAKTGYLTKSNDRISLRIPQSPADLPHPEAIPLDILYEDSDLAVIDKPAGLVCHIGAGIRSGTLVNALLYHLGPLDTGDPVRPGIVHRLDKLTSGVMVVAKNTRSHRDLSLQFKNRKVNKEYLALVYGRPAAEQGIIDMPIGRDPHNRIKISTRARKRRSAVTHYVLENGYGPFSLLRIRIETGRTHQIRVHLAHKGHPVVGDVLYGGKRNANLPAKLGSAVKELRRPFLHSHRLEFIHPASGKRMTFTSPLPDKLIQFLETTGAA